MSDTVLTHGGKIHTRVFANGKFQTRVDVADLSELIKEKDCLVWVDVLAPTHETYALLEEEFNFHPLSIEDCQKPIARAKIDEYNNYLFVVVYAIKYDPEAVDAEFNQLNAFIGPNFLVTVHNDPIHALEMSLGRCEKNPGMMEEGVGFLLYSIMDGVIDDYFPVVDAFEDRTEDLEEDLFRNFHELSIETIFRLKRELLSIRRVVNQHRDVFNLLTRRDQPLFSRQTLVYFQDIYDHLFHISDAIDIYRDILEGALNVYLSLSSNRLNEVMKMFAAYSIILMSGALIAGIYGMNFDKMPELRWHYGYVFALGAMIVLGVAEYMWFKRQGWLLPGGLGGNRNPTGSPSVSNNGKQP